MPVEHVRPRLVNSLGTRLQVGQHGAWVVYRFVDTDGTFEVYAEHECGYVSNASGELPFDVVRGRCERCEDERRNARTRHMLRTMLAACGYAVR